MIRSEETQSCDPERYSDEGSSFSVYSRNKTPPGLPSLRRRVTGNRKFEPLGSNRAHRPRRNGGIPLPSSPLSESRSSLEISDEYHLARRRLATRRLRDMSPTFPELLFRRQRMRGKLKANDRSSGNPDYNPKLVVPRPRYLGLRHATLAERNSVNLQ